MWKAVRWCALGNVVSHMWMDARQLAAAHVNIYFQIQLSIAVACEYLSGNALRVAALHSALERGYH
jgi:hypothetical protein